MQVLGRTTFLGVKRSIPTDLFRVFRSLKMKQIGGCRILKKKRKPLHKEPRVGFTPEKRGFVGATNLKLEIVDGSYFLNYHFKKVG